MYSISSLPGEILDLVFDYLEPYDLKSLRLVSRQLHDYIGHTYIQHIVLTSNRDHLKSIETVLESISIARCIKRLTFDCRALLPGPNLIRVIFPEDPMALILRNYDRIGDRYSALASRFLDITDDNGNLSDLLVSLMSIISKLPSLRRVIVADQTHYGQTLPAPRHLGRELKAIHPLFAPYVDDTLTKRLVWSGASRTHILSRTVILAVWKTAQLKCDIELRTLFARYGNGGGPTTGGLCDIIQHAGIDDPVTLAKRIWHVRRKGRGQWEKWYAGEVDGSPVIAKPAGTVTSSEDEQKLLDRWQL